MNRICFFCVFVFMANFTFVHAQEDILVLKNKKGVPILPVKGDFAVGVSAAPLLLNLGMLINDDYANSSALSYIGSDNALFGKYLINDKVGVRVAFGIDISNDKEYNKVQDDNDFTSTVTDEMTNENSNFVFSAGIERKINAARLKPYFGGELVYYYRDIKQKYKYGNDFSIMNTSPTSTISFASGFESSVSSRLIESGTGAQNGFGLRAFLGIEYFIFPKISLGGEFGFGYMYTNTLSSVSKSESWDYYYYDVQINESSKDGGSSSVLNTDSFDGQLFIMFYF